ncbi:MAG TPA: pyridoxine 5'-phosphate synthase [Rhizomicrobium sp.]|jgi:pyridoxine 5-phosphate synthase|nr:pyridoxine 5'-phosphate synthase [Rhizomicrobium sp.]
MTGRLRLGVNIDHVATVRNARGSPYPDPLRAALLAARAGADSITAHLREDRRHIADADIAKLSTGTGLPLNFEMAATEEMLAIALRTRPHAVCLVPEKREERTTEGGIDAAGQHNHLAPMIRRLSDAGIRVSLFIDPDARQIEAASSLRAPVIELCTGAYCEAVLAADSAAVAHHLDAARASAAAAGRLGLEVHAGHGLTYDNVGPIAAIAQVRELNIGHFLIGEAIFVGLENSVRHMRALMDEARGGAA